MHRGHSKFKCWPHVTEVLLQNFLQTCCYRAPLAMANDSPAMTLVDAISKLSAASDRDRRGEDMLAAAQWQPQPPGQPEQRGDPDHAATDHAKHDAHKDGEMLDRMARGDDSVPLPSLANEAISTGLNPLLFDRSPAGAIACRREVMDRLARGDDSVLRPSPANEASSSGQTRKTIGGRSTGQPASPMAMSSAHAPGSMGFSISRQLECYAKIPERVAQVPPAHAPAQPLRYKAPPPQIFLAKWKAPPDCLRDREGNPLRNKPS